MRFFLTCFILFLYSSFSSCKSSLPYGEAVINPQEILLNQENFIKYWYGYLNLSADFNPLDTSSKPISKGDFLKEVATGNFLPVRLSSDSSAYYYKLYKINIPVDDYTTLLLKGIGNEEYQHYSWEGKALPTINYTDLEDKKFTNQTIKGKILVLDFWFIGCTSCVAEMPKLNEIADQYKSRKDILFASIAFDKKKDLKKFMAKTDFKFHVLSDTASYLAKALGIRAFSTLMVINKEGKIVKYLDDQYHSLDQLKVTLKKEALQ